MSIVADFNAGLTAIQAPVNERMAFLRKTYLNLLGAVVAFAALAGVFVQAGVGESVMGFMGGNWIFMIGGLMLLAWIAQTMAAPNKSTAVQFAGLSIYVIGYALLFSPILWIVTTFPQYEGILFPAGVVTVLMFGGLSFYVFTTKKDFSFMRGALVLGGFAAFGLIVISMLFGLDLGAWFSVLMIALACGYILYDTSKVLHSYRTDQSVGAALALFSSVMLLFWYVLRLFMSSRN